MDPNKMNEKSVSRKDMILGAGKLVAGIAGAGVLAPLLLKSKPKNVIASIVTRAEPAAFGYSAIADSVQAGQDTYDEWFKNFCAYSVAYGIVKRLRADATISANWNKISLDIIRWAHGGALGWGTLCGSITGAAFVVGLVAGADPGEDMVNELMTYYSTTLMPAYTPTTQNASGIATTTQTTSNSPLCHVSVSTWMKAAGVAFYSKERSDRCARVSATMVQKTIEMLNAYKAGNYVKPTKQLSSAAPYVLQRQTSPRPSQDKGGCNTTGCHVTAVK
jgi:hypothetical protein